jgi:hypothetical protein
MSDFAYVKFCFYSHTLCCNLSCCDDDPYLSLALALNILYPDYDFDFYRDCVDPLVISFDLMTVLF